MALEALFGTACDHFRRGFVGPAARGAPPRGHTSRDGWNRRGNRRAPERLPFGTRRH